MPSGYTFKGLVGAVYNDAGSDLDDFLQNGNRVRIASTAVLTNGSANTQTSVSLATVVPLLPVEVVMDANLGRNAAAGDMTMTIFQDSTVTIGSRVVRGNDATGAQNEGGLLAITSLDQTIGYLVSSVNIDGTINVTGFNYI
jgi:hypothetical protein